MRLIEVSRTASRELGIHWNVLTNNLSASLGPTALLSGNAPFGSILASVLGLLNAFRMLRLPDLRGSPSAASVMA